MKSSIHFSAMIRHSMWTRWIAGVLAWLEWVGWQLKGGRRTSSAMPSLEKRRELLYIMKTGGLNTLIETGTFLGDTSFYFACRGFQVVTIEVEPTLARLARNRFRNTPNVRPLEGDSGALMPDIISGLMQPALFWLDGHYSGGDTGKGELETPIVAEVRAILALAPRNSIVVVDDARCFGVLPDYPSLDSFLTSLRNGGVVDVVVSNDSIRFSVP